MAGSGDAHLRPDGQALLSVKDLVARREDGGSGHRLTVRPSAVS